MNNFLECFGAIGFCVCAASLVYFAVDALCDWIKSNKSKKG